MRERILQVFWAQLGKKLESKPFVLPKLSTPCLWGLLRKSTSWATCSPGVSQLGRWWRELSLETHNGWVLLTWGLEEPRYLPAFLTPALTVYECSNMLECSRSISCDFSVCPYSAWCRQDFPLDIFVACFSYIWVCFTQCPNHWLSTPRVVLPLGSLCAQHCMVPEDDCLCPFGLQLLTHLLQPCCEDMPPDGISPS